MSYTALVLAAGSAKRFGSDKLSASFAGAPLVHHAIYAALKAPVERVIVVAHPALDLSHFDAVEIVRIDSTALSESLRAGIHAVQDADGVFVFLGDMPLIPHDIATDLAKHIGTAYAAMPRHMGKPGHPVLLSRAAFADAERLQGDAGLGKLLRQHSDVVFVECQSPYIHADVDHPEAITALEHEISSRD